MNRNRFKGKNYQVQAMNQQAFQKKKILKRQLDVFPQSLRRQILKKIKTRSWKSLEIDPDMTKTFLKASIYEFQSIKTIKKIHFCHRITPSELMKLGSSLKSLIAVQEITLYFASLYKVSAEGIYHLCQGLKRLRFLKELHIIFWIFSHMAKAFFYFLGESLKTLISLETVQLNFQESSARLLMQFPEWDLPLPKNKEGPQNILKSLKNHLKLQKLGLYFSHNQTADDVRLENFSQALKKLTLLREIDLNFTRNSEIGDAGLLNLSEALERLLSLKFLRLRFNSVSEAVIRQAKERMNRIQQLETLKIESV